MLRFIANRLSTGISQLNSVTEMFRSHPISSGFVPGGGLGESEIAPPGGGANYFRVCLYSQPPPLQLSKGGGSEVG